MVESTTKQLHERFEGKHKQQYMWFMDHSLKLVLMDPVHILERKMLRCKDNECSVKVSSMLAGCRGLPTSGLNS